MLPLQFRPLIKSARWGGTRLGTELHKEIGDLRDAAESWELCDHGQDQTVVAAGVFANWSLQRLIRERQGELFGRHTGHKHFPLLLKFLDVQDVLSLQVHPTDEQAARFVPGERGKTEAWVILEAEPSAYVYLGFQKGVQKEDVKQALATDDVERVLRRVAVKPGDVVFVPAGTVHALGPGLLLAEVQQSSVQTYRLWDWGRVGADGRPRELHLDQAFACANFDGAIHEPVRPRLTAQTPGCRSEQLLDTQWFVMHRHTATQRFWLHKDGRFRAVMCLEGAGSLRSGGEEFALGRGVTTLVPATAPQTAIVPDPSLTILEVHLR